MVDGTDIVALAPDVDRAAAASVVRVLNSRHKLLAAATCRGGHLHVLTSRGLFLGDPSLAYEEAAKGQIGRAAVASTGPDEVSVAILAWGVLQPPHRFRASEGLALARRINELVGQPPEGPSVTPVGRGRVTTRPISGNPQMVGRHRRLGDGCRTHLSPPPSRSGGLRSRHPAGQAMEIAWTLTGGGSGPSGPWPGVRLELAGGRVHR